MNFKDLFVAVTEHEPYPYQERLATEPDLPDLLDIPTGLGKTAAAVLAWLWRRRFVLHLSGEKRKQLRKNTPRRLVYCLPMRVLVEQTYEEAIRWLYRLGMLAGQAKWEAVDGRERLIHYEPEPEAGPGFEPSSWAASAQQEDPEIDTHPIAVHLLMGGEERTDWALWPERDAVLIGTQDMLLSRALNRGYAAGRARWPMDFGLLNNDCLWVFDEVQLMSSGLATGLQLAAWRRSMRLRGESGFLERRPLPIARPCQSLWMSATLSRHWLDSAVDWRPFASAAWDGRISLDAKTDLNDPRVKALFAVSKRRSQFEPVATLQRPESKEGVVDQGDARTKTNDYIRLLANRLTAEHKEIDGLTLIIVNTVDRATQLFEALEVAAKYLIHSRFRPMEREAWKSVLSRDNRSKRLIISTQVVEAGVDMSAQVLFTELAPWASLIQRFGRCARYAGEEGEIFWMDIRLGTGKQFDFAAPYERNELLNSREQLHELRDVGLQKLWQVKQSLDAPESAGQARQLFPYDPKFVPRDKDLFDLFDTTPDLTGADIDVKHFIREGKELDVQVFWREIDSASEPKKKDRPVRDELCPVPFYALRQQATELLAHGRVWRWNYRVGGWEEVERDRVELIYPGQVFLLEKSCGGYDVQRGWTGNPGNQHFPVYPLAALTATSKEADQDDDDDSDASSESGPPTAGFHQKWLTILEHTRHVCEQLEILSNSEMPAALSESERKVLGLAARWHDRGKAHLAFQAKLKSEALQAVRATLLGQEPAAKAPDVAWRRDRLGGRCRVRGSDPNSAFPSVLSVTDQDAQTALTESARETDRRRQGFRHELASALAIMETLWRAYPSHAAFSWPNEAELQTVGFARCAREDVPSWSHDQPIAELSDLSADEMDLLLYVVAAHHGKVRMSLRPSSDDGDADAPDPCPDDKRQARGVRDGDFVPACKLPGSDHKQPVFVAPSVELCLDVMEVGLSSRYGRSWRERTQGLLECYGPFRLAYLETLLLVADRRASRSEREHPVQSAEESKP